MTKTIIPWHKLIRSQNQTECISKDIQDLSKLSNNKKKQAQKAICWLLSKAPHSIEEIADHFAISPELVKGLIMDLTRANWVLKVPGSSSKYKLETEKFNLVNKINSLSKL